MTTPIRILVTGATGKTGLATVHALLKHPGVRPRALVRKEDDRARALRDAGAEVVIGDMDDIRDLQRAMKDVQRAHFIAPMTNKSLDHAMNFAVAADEARLEHVVAIGQWLSSPSHPSLMTRRTWLIDRLFSWIPNVDHTLINVGWFAENYMAVLGIAAQLGVFPLPIGADGATAPISNQDIGSVVAGVLVNPAPYVGRTLRPSGPSILSPQDVADAFGSVLGRKVRYMEVSDKMLSKTINALGAATPFEHAQVTNYLREYRLGNFGQGGTTDVVEQVTGRPAEDFVSIVGRYAKSDPMARRSVVNTLRALAQMLRIAVTSPMDVKRWEKANGTPRITGAEFCGEASEWKNTHSHANAFGVTDDETQAPPPSIGWHESGRQASI